MSQVLTTSERRVMAYNRGATPTKPSSVNRRTPLDSLNLNWREKDLPEKDRTRHVHRLHPYLGKFIPQLVEIFLKNYVYRGQAVLYPLCGYRTTLDYRDELGVYAKSLDETSYESF
jgi:hypothetical protein